MCGGSFIVFPICSARENKLTKNSVRVKILAVNITKPKKFFIFKKLSVWRYLVLGYLAIILVGSILLILPFATKAGEGSTSYLNALFTSVSATCVTGLVPYDTGIHWTAFGQAVILVLIQIGGLGFTTFVSILLLMRGKGIGAYERKIMKESYGEGVRGAVKLIKRIIVGSLSIELVGACLLCIRFVPDFGGIGVWYALFHAVSAFCNAGFDLMGGAFHEAFTSLTHYACDPLVSLVIPALIILGGLGFCIWGDVIDCKFNFKKFRLFTKIVLIASAILIFGGTALYLLFERSNPDYATYNFGQKLLCAFFNSATARTAGFSTTDPSSLSASGYLLTVFLMFIGGSSGSTAGGIKISTFVVIVMGMFAAFRGRKDVNVGKKRLDNSLVAQALAIFVSYLSLVMLSTLIICTVEECEFQRVLFETMSALGTVGLSMSLTPTLTWASKIILMLLMYTGRVGVLTLVFALGRKRSSDAVRRPEESLFIG